MSLFLAVAGAQGIELQWPAIDCPERGDVLGFLDALLARGQGGPAQIETATAAPDRIELTIRIERRTIRRSVTLIGPCDRRAATVAAVIERAITAGATETATVAAAVPATTATAGLAVSPAPREVGWIGAGGHFAVGSGGELGGGLDVEGVWWASDPIGVGARIAWRVPVIEGVAGGDVRIDELRADALLLWSVLDVLALEARLFAQLAWAESRGLLVTGRAFRFNPGVGLGARYRIPLGPVGVDLSGRALIPFRSQRFLVDGAEVAHLPRVQFELAAGVLYGF